MINTYIIQFNGKKHEYMNFMNIQNILLHRIFLLLFIVIAVMMVPIFSLFIFLPVFFFMYSQVSLAYLRVSANKHVLRLFYAISNIYIIYLISQDYANY